MSLFSFRKFKNKDLVINKYHTRKSYFFPASRSGYVNVLPDIFRAKMYSNSSALNSLPLPISDFISLFADDKTNKESDLASFLEDKLINGKIYSEPNSIGKYKFKPNNFDIDVSVGHSSSVVSETIPLVVMFKTSVTLPYLIVYEEPEAHLHPRLQRILAQVFVRLIRRGTKVVLSTHSDTLLQQFNNFLKIGRLNLDAEGRRRLSAETDNVEYGEEDWLKTEDVGAYQFRFREDGRTVVDNLEVRPDGIIAPTFNDELSRMLREALYLDRLQAEREAREAEGGAGDAGKPGPG